ncbi:MAG TPA: polysaccharide biosynthesis protein, partial [Anaeromyxobacter sp.]
VFTEPLWARTAAGAARLAVDGVLAGAALHAALRLGTDELSPAHAPRPWALAAALVACRLAVGLAAGVHRWPLRHTDLAEAARLATAAVAGSALAVAVAPWLAPPAPPRTVWALELVLSTAALAAARFGPRVALAWWSERRRRRTGATPALVVGTSFAAELLAWELRREPDGRRDVVGFATTDPAEVGRVVDGLPVVGVARELSALVARHRAGAVILAVPRPVVATLQRAIAACASAGVRFEVLPPSASLAEPVSAAMLDDLAPEDLVALAPDELERGALRRRVAGRRALVTGAGSPVGRELCRQLAHYGARRLVMVDRDRDRLFRDARRLAAERPELDLRAELVELEDPGAVERLGRRHRPDHVFHAALAEHGAGRVRTVRELAYLVLAAGLGDVTRPVPSARPPREPAVLGAARLAAGDGAA